MKYFHAPCVVAFGLSPELPFSYEERIRVQ
jgi:hypothetical protein